MSETQVIKPPLGKRLIRILIHLSLWAGAACIIGMVALFFFLRPYYKKAELYDLAKLGDYDVTTVFYDIRSEEIGRVFHEDRTVLSHAQIPDLMRKAVIASEDKRFRLHHGIDVRGIFRAVVTNLRTLSRKQGGSTITQQLSKHLIGNFKKTFDRKILEAFLARRIEKSLTKDQILDFYLNRIYFGKGYFGVGASASGYFGKSADKLSISECALLAGIIKAPTSRSPRNDLEKARHWRNVAIDKMRAQNFISSAEATIAKSAQIDLAPVTTLSSSAGGVNSYFMAMAMKELEEVLAVQEETENPQGLRVHTTLDLELQKNAEAETSRKLREVEAKIPKPEGTNSIRGPLEAAALVADLKTGALRCVIGGHDFTKTPFNRATMARRENGALLQPFLYALAFEKLHLHPASMINASFLATTDGASPEEISLGNPSKDLNKRFLTIQDALVFANKASAIRVGLQVGVPTFVSWLSSAGVVRPSTEGVGTFTPVQPLTLLEVTSLYQLMGNGGVRIKPYTIEKVINMRDETIYTAGGGTRTPLIDPQVARQMTLTLRAPTLEGSASSLTREYGFPAPVAGMTGYSEGYRDSWFVGYTPTLVAGVWVGFDESTPIGNKQIATRTALPLWNDIMQKALQGDPAGVEFPIPTGVTKVEVNRRTGAVRGQGFFAPATGAIFVYLDRPQLNTLVTEQQTAPDDAQRQVWSDWLSTMVNTSDQDIPQSNEESDAQNVIPATAEYRIPALRGNILSADGQALATMSESQNLVLSWPALEVANEDEDVLLWVKKHMAMAEALFETPVPFMDSELRGQYHFQRFHPISVIENLTPAQVAKFKTSTLPTEGFSLQGIPRRSYPNDRLFSHGVGFLRRTQGRNQRQYQAAEVIYDDYAGAYGLEAVFDTALRGKDGQFMIVTTPEGFARKAAVTLANTAGNNVRTTIDSRIQAAAELSMASVRSGAIVILNVNTGDVIAMVSRPDFDPNSFIPALSPEQWKALVNAQKNPLLNRAYRERHPPGSTFKVITSIAAMQAGVFDPERIIHCPGYFKVGNVTFLLPKETQSISYNEALTRSYNTYFMDLGLRAGRTALISAAQSFGVGKVTGIELPDEAPGLMPDPAFVRLTHKRTMGPGDVANSSIGQGDVLVTPLQMANWMAAVANNGTLHKPRLVSQIEDNTGKVVTAFPSQILNQVTLPAGPLKNLKDALVSVVQDGTATSAQVRGAQVAAKTGTAQVGSKTQPRQIAWITGYVPADRPQYSFAVMIEGDFDQDLHGGSAGGPLVAQIFGTVYSKPINASTTKRTDL